MHAHRVLYILGGLLAVMTATRAASEVVFNLECGVSPPTTETARFDEIFQGVATSDVRFQINNKGDSCNAAIQCTRHTPTGATTFIPGMVGPGKSKVLGCPADAANPITRVIVWCNGTSGNCSGTWEPVR
jgi:hypothetical protein